MARQDFFQVIDFHFTTKHHYKEEAEDVEEEEEEEEQKDHFPNVFVPFTFWSLQPSTKVKDSRKSTVHVILTIHLVRKQKTHLGQTYFYK